MGTKFFSTFLQFLEGNTPNPFARMASIPRSEAIFQDTLDNSLSTIIFTNEQDDEEGFYNNIDDKIYKNLKIIPEPLQTITYPLQIDMTLLKYFGDTGKKLYKIIEYPEKCKITYFN